MPPTICRRRFLPAPKWERATGDAECFLQPLGGGGKIVEVYPGAAQLEQPHLHQNWFGKLSTLFRICACKGLTFRQSRRWVTPEQG